MVYIPYTVLSYVLLDWGRESKKITHAEKDAIPKIDR